jgi:hypothetical protein
MRGPSLGLPAPLSNGKTQTPLRDVLRYVRRATAGMRNYRSFVDGLTNASHRPPSDVMPT